MSNRERERERERALRVPPSSNFTKHFIIEFLIKYS